MSFSTYYQFEICISQMERMLALERICLYALLSALF